MERYEHYSDEELVALYKSGTKCVEDVLIKRYSKNIHHKAKGYFMHGMELDDLYQEGLVGFYQALKSYREQEAVPFCVFASICIHRRFITVIKKAQAHKHRPLNESMSLEANIAGDGESLSLMDLLSIPKEQEPENAVIDSETINDLMVLAQSLLSDFEYQVLIEFMQSKSYSEIASAMHCTNKAVDNALQRIKRKLIGSYS